ncbi:MAG: hypothetical protein L0338_23075 [Acidobacteria bacterium]|nr:hypothetical protein [Acidobacteriota bacterium]
MKVEFDVELRELRLALKYLFAPKVPKKYARPQFVDFYVRESEVQLVTTGADLVFPAQVIQGGYGRAPYMAIDWLRKVVGSLSRSPVLCTVEPGRIRVGNLSFTSPDVTILPLGARIADIPAEAGLADVLALLVKYRPEELEDSGLLARVLAAQEETSKLMDRAVAALKPLEISREELGRFVWTQIKVRVQKHPPIVTSLNADLTSEVESHPPQRKGVPAVPATPEEYVQKSIETWRSIVQRNGEDSARESLRWQKTALAGCGTGGGSKYEQMIAIRRVELAVFGSIQEVPGERELLGLGRPVECWQWRRYAGGSQPFGNRIAIYELDEALFETFIKPQLKPGYAATLADYQARHPDQKYISLTQIGGEGPESFMASGSLDQLRPQAGFVEFARRVSTFESTEAKEWGALCDPEEEPLNEERHLMRLLGFKHLRALEEWLSQPTPSWILERFTDEEEEEEEEEFDEEGDTPDKRTNEAK